MMCNQQPSLFRHHWSMCTRCWHTICLVLCRTQVLTCDSCITFSFRRKYMLGCSNSWRYPERTKHTSVTCLYMCTTAKLRLCTHWPSRHIWRGRTLNFVLKVQAEKTLRPHVLEIIGVMDLTPKQLLNTSDVDASICICMCACVVLTIAGSTKASNYITCCFIRFQYYYYVENRNDVLSSPPPLALEISIYRCKGVNSNCMIQWYWWSSDCNGGHTSNTHSMNWEVCVLGMVACLSCPYLEIFPRCLSSLARPHSQVIYR